MRKMEVMVGVDGSDAGMNALREAAGLAASLGWRLAVVSVVPPYGGNMNLLNLKRAQHNLAAPFQEILDRALETARAAGAEAVGILEEGKPYERLVDLAAARGTELTVLGSGLSFMERLVSGNTIRRVVGYGMGDVLVVPQGTHFDCRLILNPVDGSRAGFTATDKALDLGRMFGGTVLSLHVIEAETPVRDVPELMDGLACRGRECLAEVQARAEAIGVDLETMNTEGLAPEVIARTARERGASLVVMSARGEGGLRRLLMGSVTSKVMKLAPCPIYIAHN